MKFYVYALAVALLGSIAMAHAQTPLHGTHLSRSELPGEEGFVSRGSSVSMVLNAIAGKLGQPAIVSQKAQKKRIDGAFDLLDPSATLEAVCKELGLIWYSDGQSLYVYDASETRTAIGNLRHASVASLEDFLRQAEVDDARYPVRGRGVGGTFYVSGPPNYVESVLNAARFIDDLYWGEDSGTTHVEVIRIENGFVGGRQYGVRGTSSVLPGIVDALRTMLSNDLLGGEVLVNAPQPEAPIAQSPLAPIDDQASPNWPASSPTGVPAPVVVAHAQSNSILVRGTREQIRQARLLVAAMDVARRQIELSLWIIDVKKSAVDRLGVNWSGSVSLNDNLGVSFNREAGAVTALDGGMFLASVSALMRTGAASVVSRPVLMTQENVEAHFDANHTIYEPLVGERVTSLEAVTYGTLVSVLPRLSGTGEIEMQLRIEDGTANATGQTSLPVVARTSIDTIARVPPHLSLLVGGYTRSAEEHGVDGIPGLQRIPGIGGLFRTKRNLAESMVRVFLIQPRVLDASDQLSEQGIKDRLPEAASQRIEELRELMRSPPDAAPAFTSPYDTPLKVEPLMEEDEADGRTH